jgi:dihydroxyacid dehydratase/phosphogluconate dehydratase
MAPQPVSDMPIASAILTRDALLNAVVTCAALGGSTNAHPHLMAIARHAGAGLTHDDWRAHGHDVPLLADVKPAGRWLGERFHRAGGVPAVMRELLDAGLLRGGALTVTGRTMAENLEGRAATDREVIRPFAQPLRERAGFLVLTGNLFDHAIMKTSVISDAFRARYLADPAHPDRVDLRAAVFEGSEDYHARIDDPALGIDEMALLVIRGAGPVGWPGGAEVVNMQPPAALVARGIASLPTLGDGRQSGTSDSPSILNASPEAARGGGLARLRTGDVVRLDLRAGRVDALVPDAEWAAREAVAVVPPSRTPWEAIHRATVGALSEGAVIEEAVAFRGTAATPPRHNH